MKSVGFLGAGDMTALAAHAVWKLLDDMKPAVVHHGDCHGADEQLHMIVLPLLGKKPRVIGHVSQDGKDRAFCQCAETRFPTLDLARQKAIVDESDAVIVLGDSLGRMAAYAASRKKSVFAVSGNGSVLKDGVAFPLHWEASIA